MLKNFLPKNFFVIKSFLRKIDFSQKEILPPKNFANKKWFSLNKNSLKIKLLKKICLKKFFRQKKFGGVVYGGVSSFQWNIVRIRNLSILIVLLITFSCNLVPKILPNIYLYIGNCPEKDRKLNEIFHIFEKMMKINSALRARWKNLVNIAQICWNIWKF